MKSAEDCTGIEDIRTCIDEIDRNIVREEAEYDAPDGTRLVRLRKIKVTT
jgi:hypothetical protein